MGGADGSQSSDLANPLHELSGLSMFPRTFRDSTNAPLPNRDPESIHEYMKSLALRSPSKHLEQAKAIVDGNPELLISEFDGIVDSATAGKVKGKENVRERRPGLGRRRPMFVLKPLPSEPSVLVEPSLDINKLEDPEDFIREYEKYDRAKKELDKLRGLTNNNLPKRERVRRPGLGRRRATFTFKYPLNLTPPRNDDTVRPSQETVGQDILSPADNTSQPETAVPNVELQEKEITGTGSIQKSEDRYNDLFDELLSDSELDADATQSILEERLQIKPPDLDELRLPNFHDVEMFDFRNLKKKLSEPQNMSLDKWNLVKETSGKGSVKEKQGADILVPSLVVPSPQKYPRASVSLLQKSIFESSLLHDPFSALDLSPPGNSSSTGDIGEPSDHYNKRTKLGVSSERKSVTAETGDVRADDTSSQEMLTGDSLTPSEEAVDDYSERLSVGINFATSASSGELQDKSGIRNMDEIDSMHDTGTDIQANGANEMEENDSRFSTDTDVQAIEPNKLEENVEEMLENTVISGDVNLGDASNHYDDLPTNGPHERQTNVKEVQQNAEPDINIEDPTTGTDGSNQRQPDACNPAAVGAQAMDAPPEMADEEPSQVSFNKRGTTTRPSRSGRKRKALSHRQSLAGAGTVWESGVRRSKRITMRPLEYWKGERFLFGRIHQSLTSVIGVKYESPAKGDAKPSLKVKSFVSNKHKELVELAALH